LNLLFPDNTPPGRGGGKVIARLSPVVRADAIFGPLLIQGTGDLWPTEGHLPDFKREVRNVCVRRRSNRRTV
jgi:hypothetical protein